MSQTPSVGIRGDVPGGTLGVIDAMGMGWRLLMSDFWPLWLVGLVALLLLMVANSVPFGQCIAGPPLVAGFFWVLMRRIDGGEANVGGLFEGFRQRFVPSIISVLPLLIAWLVFAVIYIVLYLLAVLPTIMHAHSGAGAAPEKMLIFVLPVLGVNVLLSLAISVIQMFFIFALVAVWDYPLSGWEAARVSMRMVWERFWSVLGFCVLAWLIGVAASVGWFACCVGILFTLPVAMVWVGGAVVYLYRSWTGQALAQPIGAAPPAGPVPPTSIEPPPRGM